MPVIDGRAGDSSFEYVRRKYQRVNSHVTAVTPASDPNALRIDKSHLNQVLDTQSLVCDLQFSQLMIDTRFERQATTLRSAIIKLPHHIAAVCQHLLPIEARPVVPDRLRARA